MRGLLLVAGLMVACGGGAAGDGDAQTDGERPDDWIDMTCTEVFWEMRDIEVHAVDDDRCAALIFGITGPVNSPEDMCDIVWHGFEYGGGLTVIETECGDGGAHGFQCTEDDQTLCSKIAGELVFRFGDCDCRRE